MQSQTASKEVNLIQMKNNYEIIRFDFANFLQISNDFELEEIVFEEYEIYIKKIQNLDSDETNILMNNIIEIAIINNPSLKITSTSTQINQKALRIAQGNFLPSINLSYSQNWKKTNLDDTYNNQGTIMLNASIPIFPIFDNYAGVKQAKYDLIESEYNYRTSEDAIILMIKQALYNLIASAKSVYSSKIALDYAEETYKQMEIRFKNNLINSSDLLDAEVLLTFTKNQYIISFYNFLRAKSLLMQQIAIIDNDEFWNLLELLEGDKNYENYEE